MGIRYYKFFAIMRTALKNKQLNFAAPGNKNVHKVLILLRDSGLIGGFSLDFKLNWIGYPRYRVFLKYSYFGIPVIKRLDCYKATRSNYTRIKEEFPRIRQNNYWLVADKGIRMLTDVKTKKNAVILARVKT